jgi:hypothetical protein
MKVSPLIIITLLALNVYGALNAQQTINLINPSFEDIPRAGNPGTPPINGWNDCGKSKFPNETPPDIQPGSWGVTTKAFEGKTYISLVTRDNDSWESISQRLESKIIAGKCYSMSASLCVSLKYKSRTKHSPDTLNNFSNPIVLLIWGGDSYCDKSEFLAESTPVDNEEWLEYPFDLKPAESHEYITLEAFYVTPILESYNGHLLVDNLSPIFEISCQ